MRLFEVEVWGPSRDQALLERRAASGRPDKKAAVWAPSSGVADDVCFVRSTRRHCGMVTHATVQHYPPDVSVVVVRAVEVIPIADEIVHQLLQVPLHQEPQLPSREPVTHDERTLYEVKWQVDKAGLMGTVWAYCTSARDANRLCIEAGEEQGLFDPDEDVIKCEVAEVPWTQLFWEPTILTSRLGVLSPAPQ